MATDIEILARLITNQVLTIDAGAGKSIGDLTNSDASGSIYQSWLKICTPLVPWINTHGSGSSGTGSIWGYITGTLSDQTDLYNELTTLSGSIVNRELLVNKSTDTNLGTSNTLYPSQNAVKTYVDNNKGESNTASNLGSGTGIYSQKIGSDLQFKSLVAGSNVTITNNSDDIIINSNSVSGSVLLQDTTPGIPQSGNVNLEGAGLFNILGIGTSYPIYPVDINNVSGSLLQAIIHAGQADTGWFFNYAAPSNYFFSFDLAYNSSGFLVAKRTVGSYIQSYNGHLYFNGFTGGTIGQVPSFGNPPFGVDVNGGVIVGENYTLTSHPSGGVLLVENNIAIGTKYPTSKLQIVELSIYANNAAAISGGLTTGAFYRTGGDPDLVCVVH